MLCRHQPEHRRMGSQHSRRLRAYNQLINQNQGELLMPFDRFIGIDWSGALDPRRKIQVAEYVPANDHTVRLVDRPRGPAAAWRRQDVFEYLQQQVRLGTALIGLDFAFAYPYCYRQAYFPGEPESPPDPLQLWETVEQYCGGVGNLYGGPFYRDLASPFRRYHRYPGYEGDLFENRFRITEQEAQRRLDLNPTSIFDCIGPAQVGPGSVAGMRLLLRIHNETEACIWPFDVNAIPNRPTVVEIYPRLFLRHAQNADIAPTAGSINQLCAHFGANLQDPPGNPTGDKRDALVSAAGMGWFAHQALNRQVPPCPATFEGWIFGVPIG